MEKLEQIKIGEMFELLLSEKNLHLSEINYLYYMNYFGVIKKINFDEITIKELMNDKIKFYCMPEKED